MEERIRSSDLSSLVMFYNKRRKLEQKEILRILEHGSGGFLGFQYPSSPLHPTQSDRMTGQITANAHKQQVLQK